MLLRRHRRNKIEVVAENAAASSIATPVAPDKPAEQKKRKSKANQEK